MRAAAVLLLLALSDAALAQAARQPGRALSIGDATTLGAGEAAAYVSAGYPRFALGYVQGVVDALDLGGELSFDLSGEAARATAWSRYVLYDDGRVAAAARLAAGAAVLGLPGTITGVALEAAPGISLGVMVGTDLVGTALLEMPARIATTGRDSALAAGLTLGVDRIFPRHGAALGVFVQGTPNLLGPRDLGLAAGLRASLSI